MCELFSLDPRYLFEVGNYRIKMRKIFVSLLCASKNIHIKDGLKETPSEQRSFYIIPVSVVFRI